MIVEMDSENARIRRFCPFCGGVTEEIVPTHGYGAYLAGVPIQKAMPTVSATIREFVMTGMCRDCQDKVFGEDEEEE